MKTIRLTKRRSWWLALFAPKVVAQIPAPKDAIDSGWTNRGDGTGRSAFQSTGDYPDPNKDMIGFLRWTLNNLHRRVEIVEDKVALNRKPINNQCPVCGTMAKPYVRDVSKMAGCAPAPCDPGGGCFAICRSWTINDLPKSQEVRCAHCNAAFWQDAEVAK